MIKIKLYTEEALETLLSSENKPENIVTEPQDFFTWTMLDTFRDKKCPFRDAESIKLLKETYDITFASDEDWYSVYCENRRMSISCLNTGIKFALAAIYISRQGRYTWFNRKSALQTNDVIWKVLADLPVDILVAIRIEEMSSYTLGFGDIDCKIENYPYKDQRVEVTVKDDCMCKNDFYKKVPEEPQDSTCYGLYVGRDGRYYSSFEGIHYALRYHWKNDIEGIIKYIEKEYPKRIRLAEVTKIYDTFSFAKALKVQEESVVWLEFVHVWRLIEEDYHEGGMSKEEYEKWFTSICKGKDYEEYLYFKDTFKIISHLTVVPESTTSRKLPILIVDKNKDGTYTILGDLTFKYPALDECISQVVNGRSSNRERFMLVIDVEEVLDSVRDIGKAAYGFKLLADSIEIFDEYEAVQMFGQALKEAYYSENCTIRDGFY